MTSPADIFRDSVYSILNTVHTCLPGRIISFDASTNKATIQPALNKAYLSGAEPMGIMSNVPVLFPKNIYFPIVEGDYVLVLFAERAIDLWLTNGGVVTPNDPRKFNLSDGIAIPGLQPFNADFSNRNADDFQITYAGSSIRIKSDGSVIIESSSTIAIGTQTTEILNILSQLMQLLQGATVMGAAFGGPLNPAFTAQVALIQAQLNSITGTI